MTDSAVLIKEIQSLPPSRWGEVLDFVEYLKQINAEDSEESAYQAMAADTDREQEASEWCGAYFGPLHNK